MSLSPSVLHINCCCTKAPLCVFIQYIDVTVYCCLRNVTGMLMIIKSMLIGCPEVAECQEGIVLGIKSGFKCSPVCVCERESVCSGMYV